METSSTYPKFSFLRLFYTLVLVPLLLVSPGLVGDVMGQTKELAVVYQSDHVDGATNANADNDQFATLNASPGALLGIASYNGKIGFQFPSELPANTTTYVRIRAEEAGLLDALLGGSIGNLVTGLVDGLLLGDHF